jgi:hypothetical protein
MRLVSDEIAQMNWTEKQNTMMGDDEHKVLARKEVAQ